MLLSTHLSIIIKLFSTSTVAEAGFGISKFQQLQSSLPFFPLFLSPIMSHMKDRHRCFPKFFILMYLNFNQRSNISPMCNREIISYAQQNDSTEDQDTVVHGHRGSWRCRWPETEEDDDDHKCAGQNVDRDTQNPWDSERTPLQT